MHKTQKNYSNPKYRGYAGIFAAPQKKKTDSSETMKRKLEERREQSKRNLAEKSSNSMFEGMTIYENGQESKPQEPNSLAFVDLFTKQPEKPKQDDPFAGIFDDLGSSSEAQPIDIDEAFSLKP